MQKITSLLNFVLLISQLQSRLEGEPLPDNISLRSNITRTELPSCEAIDGKKVKIAYIVIPVTKLKVRVNLGLLPTLISFKLVSN